MLVSGIAYAQTTDAPPPPPRLRAGYPDSRLVTLSPIQFTENGIGFSLGYEQDIDRAGIVAFRLPILATFNLAKNNAQNGYKNDPMYYFTPGVKFYPSGSYGPVKYAIGPTLVVGGGRRSTYTNKTYLYENKFLLGVAVNNSVNIYPAKHFYLGIDLGLGITYVNKIGGENQGVKPIVQGSFMMGYRF